MQIVAFVLVAGIFIWAIGWELLLVGLVLFFIGALLGKD